MGDEWYRLGGIVDMQGNRIAQDLVEWTERTFINCGKNLQTLIDHARDEKLIATVSLRDLVISSPELKLADIMNKQVISVQDEDKIDRLASIILKYDLLAIPVTDAQNTLVGMVVIDDIIEDLMDKGKTKKSSRSWR